MTLLLCSSVESCGLAVRTEVLEVLSHELHHLVVHLLRGVQAPDEVQVLPVRDALVVDQVGDLLEEQVHVVGVGQRVVAPRPQSGGHLHVRHMVQWRGRLEGAGHTRLETNKNDCAMTLRYSGIYLTETGYMQD